MRGNASGGPSRRGFLKAIGGAKGSIPERLMWWDGERAREAGLGEVFDLMKEAFCASNGEELDAPLSTLQAFATLSRQMSEFHSGAATAFPRPLRSPF